MAGLRIATWNVNGLRARLDFVRHWLRSRAPDVVGMQELKATDGEFPHEAFNALGYEVVTHGQKGWNGVAIASRHPIETTQCGLPGQEEFGARLLRARILPADAEALDFATVYCPNGKTLVHADFLRKLAWYADLSRYLAAAQPGRLFALGGDFNIVPAAIDCWRGAAADGSIFCTEEERACYQRLLDSGLADLYRHRHPQQQAFSWWDYRGGSFHLGRGLRIDTLLGTPALAECLRDAVIDRDYRKKQNGLTASDHAPVYVDLA